MKTKKKLATVGVNVLAWVVSLVLITPLLLILFNSLKTSLAASDMSLALPTSFEWSNFTTVIEKGKLGTAFLNSILYSVGSVLLTTVLASMAAYTLSRNRSKLHNFLYFFLVLGITMPINFVALMKVMQFFHLTNTRGGIILKEPPIWTITTTARMMRRKNTKPRMTRTAAVRRIQKNDPCSQIIR